MTRLGTIAMLLLTAVTVAGCTSRGDYSLSPEDTALPPCVGIEEVTVESLADRVPADCDLGNVTLVFPDGFTTLAPFVGQAAASGSHTIDPDLIITYSMWNLGIDGVVVARTQPHNGTSEFWGSPQGVTRIKETNGADIQSIVQ